MKLRWLCVEMLVSGRLADSRQQARQKLQDVLDNGKAAEVFARMVCSPKWSLQILLKTTINTCQRRY